LRTPARFVFPAHDAGKATERPVRGSVGQVQIFRGTLPTDNPNRRTNVVAQFRERDGSWYPDYSNIEDSRLRRRTAAFAEALIANRLWESETPVADTYKENPMRADEADIRQHFNDSLDRIIRDAGTPGARLHDRREVREWVSAEYDHLIHVLADLYGTSLRNVKRIVGGSFKREAQNEAVAAWAEFNE